MQTTTVERARRDPRIVMLTADYPPHVWSGVGVTVQTQARALARLGRNVHVVVGAPGRLGPRAPRRPERRSPSATSDTQVSVWPLDAHAFPLAVAAGDWVHLHSLGLAPLALELQRRFGCRLAYTLHTDLEQELVWSDAAGSRGASQWTSLQRDVLARADRVVVLSRSEELRARRNYPLLHRRFVLVPNGIAAGKPRAHDTPPSPRERAAGGPITFVGRLTRSKGVELLDAILRQALQNPERTALLIGGHADATGRRLVSRLLMDFPTRCQLRGWLPHDEALSLLATAGVVVVPSLYEPFGMVCLEAQAIGVPVVVAATGGLEDMTGVRSGAVCVPGRDPALWVSAIDRVVDSPELHRRLAALGPKFVRRHFDVDALARCLNQNVYQLEHVDA